MSAPENPAPILEEAEIQHQVGQNIDFEIFQGAEGAVGVGAGEEAEKEPVGAGEEVLPAIALPTPSPSQSPSSDPALLPKRGRPRRLYNESRKRGQGKAHHIGKRLKRHKTNDEHLPLTEGRIKEMKVLELREELRRRNLPMSGLKAAIIE
eukprot:TCONS_00034090-protein